MFVVVFFFNDTATTEIYTLSLHDALPIFRRPGGQRLAAAPVPLAAARRDDRPGPARRDVEPVGARRAAVPRRDGDRADRKSTRLNSSHANISYAVFCLKKKKTKHHKTAH